MIQHENPQAADFSGANRFSLLDRLYTFTVVGAAMLFLALALWPNSKNKMSVLESVWSYRTNDSESFLSSENIDQVNYAIKSPDAIRAAIETVSPSIGKRGYADWQQTVAESVAVVVERDTTGKNVNIRVRAGGNNEMFCSELLTALQEQFQQRYHQPVDHASIGARDRLEQEVVRALKLVDKEHAVIESHVKERLEQARAAVQARARQTTENVLLRPPTSTATVVPPEESNGTSIGESNLPKVETANPDYIAIQEEINRIEAQALTLGSPTTNPQSSSGNSLEALRALLDETPKSIPVAGDWVANPFSSEAKSMAMTNPFADQVEEKVSEEPAEIEIVRHDVFDAYAEEQAIRNGAEYRRLLERLDASKQAHLAAINTLNSTPKASMNASQVVELIQPPGVVKRYRSGMSSTNIWKYLIPCGLAGLVCALFSATQRNPETFYNEDDTTSWLDLPAIGTIKTDRGPTIQYPYHAQRSWARWSRHAAELVLVLTLLALLYSLATFDGFSQMLARDPFAGFLTAVDQVKGLMVRGG